MACSELPPPPYLEGEDAVVVAADDAEAGDGQGLGGVTLREDERAVRGARRALVCCGGGELILLIVCVHGGMVKNAPAKLASSSLVMPSTLLRLLPPFFLSCSSLRSGIERGSGG